MTPAPTQAPASADAGASGVELLGLTRRYGRTLANDAVTLRIAPGTIHGIVGENGAGKSTLMKMLAGWEEPDAGEIRLFGRPVRLRSSAAARRAGVGMIFQHFMMVDRLSVIDNLLLHEGRHLSIARGRARLAAELGGLMREYGLEVPLDRPFETLPLGQRQWAELLKALVGNARVLILDEPTAVLTPGEVTALFGFLRRLRGEGRTIVFVTHKLHEVMALCDRVTVMRQARTVETMDIAAASPQRLAELMIGRPERPPAPRRKVEAPRVRLRLEGLVLREGGRNAVDVPALELAEGEILGIAGVAGNGQSELLELLSGQRRPDGGRMLLDGAAIEAARWPDALAARRLGIGHIPEDRQGTALLAGLSVADSLIFGQEYRPAYSRWGLLNRAARDRTAARLIAAFDIRPAAAQMPVGQLSGGNQQKVVVAREIDAAPRLLLVGQPTRGVDIGSIRNIHDRLTDYRNAGGSILLVSSELDELFALSDRITVAFAGQLHGAFARDAFGDGRIGQFMAGVFDGAGAAA